MNQNSVDEPARRASSKANIAVDPVAVIQGVYPYLKSIISLVILTLLGLYRVLVYLTSQLVKPILVLSPIPIILYILSPVFTFCQVLLDVLVFAPVRTAVYILDAVYPLYVFVGVACITGCLLGLAARFVSEWLVKMVDKPARSKPQNEVEDA
ncbi:hypothetical protein JOM56_014629 [Amanita muscaria]